MSQISGEIRAASPLNLKDVLQLLDINGLPTVGVQQHLDQFLVCEINPKSSVESHIVGCVGLEVYGKDALLRSLSVHPQYQSKGIGTLLLNSIIIQAIEMLIENLFLLTITADGYFERCHFTQVSRDEVPAIVKESVEFLDTCPSTAICMIRKLEA